MVFVLFLADPFLVLSLLRSVISGPDPHRLSGSASWVTCLLSGCSQWEALVREWKGRSERSEDADRPLAQPGSLLLLQLPSVTSLGFSLLPRASLTPGLQ